MTDHTHHARRAALYGYVATAFHYPDEGTHADLTDPDVREAVREAAAELDLDAEADRLLSALEDTSQSSLAAVYNELFGLPEEDGTYPVVPYEAHYTVAGAVSDVQRRIATVVGLLERFGLEPREEFDERQDHVAVELELMQVIAAQRAVAAETGEKATADRLGDAEATVLEEHLGDFLPSLSKAISEATRSETYLAAADLATKLVERDAAARADRGVSARA